MSNIIIVKLDIGYDLRASIAAVIDATDHENERSHSDTLSPGNEVKKAFGIDLTDIIKHTVSLKIDRS